MSDVCHEGGEQQPFCFLFFSDSTILTFFLPCTIQQFFLCVFCDMRKRRKQKISMSKLCPNKCQNSKVEQEAKQSLLLLSCRNCKLPRRVLLCIFSVSSSTPNNPQIWITNEGNWKLSSDVNKQRIQLEHEFSTEWIFVTIWRKKKRSSL